MTLPRGAVWQELRAACLDAVPPETRVDWRHPTTLARWQATGFYTVSSMTSTRFLIVAPSSDLGGALLADAEYFLDHAAEQQVTLHRHIHSADWLSPAWLAVTLYYWGFFLTLALTRLLGMSAWYITRDVARDLRRLSPTPVGIPPGAGSFRIACGSVVSATDRELLLSKTKRRVHEEAWVALWESLDSKLSAVPQRSRDPWEDRLYTAMTRAGRYLGADWPSAFRNIVNYRPGLGYTAVRRARVLSSLAYLDAPTTYPADVLIDRLENSVARIQPASPIAEQLQGVSELLAYYVFAVYAIVNGLHGELIERHRLDPRGHHARKRFLREHGLMNDDGTWPT